MTTYCKSEVPDIVWDALSPIKEVLNRPSTFIIALISPPSLSFLSSRDILNRDVHVPIQDDQAVKDYGVKLCTQMCEELLAAGCIPGFHFYTLNLEKSVMRIIKDLGIRFYDQYAPLGLG